MLVAATSNAGIVPNDWTVVLVHHLADDVVGAVFAVGQALGPIHPIRDIVAIPSDHFCTLKRDRTRKTDVRSPDRHPERRSSPRRGLRRGRRAW